MNFLTSLYIDSILKKTSSNLHILNYFSSTIRKEIFLQNIFTKSDFYSAIPSHRKKEPEMIFTLYRKRTPILYSIAYEDFKAYFNVVDFPQYETYIQIKNIPKYIYLSLIYKNFLAGKKYKSILLKRKWFIRNL